MLVLLLLLITRLTKRSGLRISHSKVFSSDQIRILYVNISFLLKTDFQLWFLLQKYFGKLSEWNPFNAKNTKIYSKILISQSTLLCRFSNYTLAVQFKVGLQRLAQLGNLVYSVHRWGVNGLKNFPH